MAEGLSIWVVYDHPADFPHCFVAREHVAAAGKHAPTSNVMVCPDLDMIRRELQRRGLVKLDRDPSDEPVILEVWL